MRVLCSQGPEYCAVAISLESVLKHSNHLFSQDSALGTHSFLFHNSDDNTLIYCHYAWVSRQSFAYHSQHGHGKNDGSRSDAGQDHAVCRVATIGLGSSSYTETALITADAGIAKAGGCLLAGSCKP